MRRFSRLVAAVLLATFTQAAAQGGGAVITLEMPPPAGDGHAALQSGSAIPAGVASAWYNPALLAGLRKSTGSNIHFTASERPVAKDLWVHGLDTWFPLWRGVVEGPGRRTFREARHA